MKMKVFDIIDNCLAHQPLESMAEMPEMLIVGNLEDAERLRRKNSLFQRLVVFFPTLISYHRERGAPLEYLSYGIRGIRVDSRRLSANMARLYVRNGSSPELAQRALQNLDHEIRDASARRAQEMDRLCRSAQGFEGEPPPSALGDFVKQIISSQFEFPELLIREAVQNADGSWDKKSENRIDVVLDAASRTITVSARAVV